MKRATLKSVVQMVVKDDFQGNFFEDFYNSQGDYTDSAPIQSEIKKDTAGECHSKQYNYKFVVRY